MPKRGQTRTLISVRIENGLLARAKAKAAEKSETITGFIERAIGYALGQSDNAPRIPASEVVRVFREGIIERNQERLASSASPAHHPRCPCDICKRSKT